MQQGDRYKNGQIKSDQQGDTLTWYFANGNIKARGLSIKGVMQGEWRFFRETGQLWQVGHLLNDQKHGAWIRYDRKGNEEYRENFAHGKVIRPAKRIDRSS